MRSIIALALVLILCACQSPSKAPTPQSQPKTVLAPVNTDLHALVLTLPKAEDRIIAEAVARNYELISALSWRGHELTLTLSKTRSVSFWDILDLLGWLDLDAQQTTLHASGLVETQEDILPGVPETYLHINGTERLQLDQLKMGPPKGSPTFIRRTLRAEVNWNAGCIHGLFTLTNVSFEL